MFHLVTEHENRDSFSVYAKYVLSFLKQLATRNQTDHFYIMDQSIL